MKITFIGTGTMGSLTRCNTSVLIDDILFDIGMGTIKQIGRLKINTKSICYLVISHFHADHFLDIPNLLIGSKEIRKEKEQKLTIIGPTGLRKKVMDLMSFTHGDGDQHKYDKIEEKYNIEFVELKNEEQYCAPNFKLTALALQHGNCVPVNGYILEKQNQKISYVCDTTFCENFDKICQISDYILLDVNGLETTKSHMGLQDLKKVCTNYPKCRFYAVHRADYDIERSDQIAFPKDGEILEIGE